MAIIRLHVQNESRRRALASALKKEHEVTTGGSGEDRQEQLLILDHPTLQRTGVKAVRSYKQNDPRPASPVLLLVPSSRKSDLTPEIWAEIDEVIEIPVRWPEMSGRVAALIRLQKCAKEVETFQQLSAKYKLMLEEQQRRLAGYKDLFKNAEDKILVLHEGTVIEATFQAEQLFGVEDLVGKSLRSLSSPNQPGTQNSLSTPSELLDVEEGETREVEWGFERPGGTPFSCSIVLSRLRFRGKKCLQIVFQEGVAET